MLYYFILHIIQVKKNYLINMFMYNLEVLSDYLNNKTAYFKYNER